MNIARIVVLAIALTAGGIAAYLASGSDNKSAPTEPVTQLQTVDVLVAKADIGLGQTLTPNDVLWQSWPAAAASGTFIRRNDRPDAANQVAGSIARYSFVAGEPIRRGEIIAEVETEKGVIDVESFHHPFDDSDVWVRLIGSLADGDLWVLDGSGPHQLATGGTFSQPTWAPDGRHITFVSDRSGSRQLWVIDVETGRVRQLKTPGAARLPAWSRRLSRTAVAPSP